MSQELLLVASAIAWSIVFLDAAVHLVLGDLVVPVAMTLIFIAWVGIRRHRLARATVRA